MDWTAVKTFLIGAWVSISGPRLYLVAGLGAATCAIWLLLSGLERGIISSLRTRLSLAEQRYRDFEREFGGRTPAQVAARFRQLEGYLASLPPRRLNDEQKRVIADAGYPPLAASHLSILYDSISGEAGRYARDFIEAFLAAHGWNLVDETYPMPSHTISEGIAVGLGDPGDPTPTEMLVLQAFRVAGISHDLVHRTTHGADVEIIVTAR